MSMTLLQPCPACLVCHEVAFAEAAGAEVGTCIATGRLLRLKVDGTAELASGERERPRDTVNHPPHYTFGRIEVIDAIEAWQLGFHLGNAVKYLARAEHKGDKLGDLKKARWYLDREIKRLETAVERCGELKGTRAKT